MLSTLTGVARVAVGLMYFCGLRPGEARAVCWKHYDANRRVLQIRGSMFGTQLSTTKTEDSDGVVLSAITSPASWMGFRDPLMNLFWPALRESR